MMVQFPGTKERSKDLEVPALLRVKLWLGLQAEEDEWHKLQTEGELAVFAETVSVARPQHVTSISPVVHLSLALSFNFLLSVFHLADYLCCDARFALRLTLCCQVFLPVFALSFTYKRVFILFSRLCIVDTLSNVNRFC